MVSRNSAKPGAIIDNPKRVLFIELLLHAQADDVLQVNQIRKATQEWLRFTHADLIMNEKHTDFSNLPSVHSHYIVSLKLVDATNFNKDTILFPVADDKDPIKLSIMAYQLKPLSSISTLSAEVGNDRPDKDGSSALQEIPDARVIPLPNTAYYDLWESLEFDSQLPRKLLRTIVRMEHVSSRLKGTWSMNWNRLVLLYGPPGTGKTSLCRAIAQKLGIRYSDDYQVKVVEINAHSLSSKYFSESGKLVQKMFETVEAMLQSMDEVFVIVLIDEVETLTARRENSMNGSEPLDGMKAVNALLTGLDRIKGFKNVIVLCTTNLITALDSAFMDRIDIKQQIPHPSQKVIYEILRAGYNSLQASGLLTPFNLARSDQTESGSNIVVDRELPPHDEIFLHYWDPFSFPMRLLGIAQKAEGLSGRTLRRLPVLSIVHNEEDNVRFLWQALAALETAIMEEFAARPKSVEL